MLVFPSALFAKDAVVVPPAVPIDPATLFPALGAYWDLEDMGSLWADAAGTTPAVVDGVVKRIDDQSPNGINLISTGNSLLRSAAGINSIEIVTGGHFTAPLNLTSTAQLIVWLAFEPSTNGLSIVAEFGSPSYATVGSFMITNSEHSVGDIDVLATASAYEVTHLLIPANGSGVRTLISTEIDLAQAAPLDKMKTRINAISGLFGVHTSSPDTPVNFANQILSICARETGIFPMLGKWFGGVLLGELVDAETKHGIELWLAERAGLDL